MKIRKKIISPERLRRVPEGFGWVDHRLVRKGHIRHHSSEELSLYLFLVTVADVDGVSWYSDETLGSYLNFDEGQLRATRRKLVESSLIAFQRPFYQVLEMPTTELDEHRFRSTLRAALSGEAETTRGGPVHIGEAIDIMTGGFER